MSRLTDRVGTWLRRRRPVSEQEFAEVANWVNEGGALDPAGPPPLIADDEEENGPEETETRPR